MKNDSVKIFDASAAAGNGVTQNVLIDNPGASGCDILVDITDEDLGGGAGSLTLTLQGVDAFGKKYTILASAALVAAAATRYSVGRGLTAAANVVANAQLPAKLNVLLTHNNANPMQYTVSMNLSA